MQSGAESLQIMQLQWLNNIKVFFLASCCNPTHPQFHYFRWCQFPYKTHAALFNLLSRTPVFWSWGRTAASSSDLSMEPTQDISHAKGWFCKRINLFETSANQPQSYFCWKFTLSTDILSVAWVLPSIGRVTRVQIWFWLFWRNQSNFCWLLEACTLTNAQSLPGPDDINLDSALQRHNITCLTVPFGFKFKL